MADRTISREPRESSPTSYFDRLGFSPVDAGRQISLQEAFAFFLHDIQFPLLLDGEHIGPDFVAQGEIATLGENLFPLHFDDDRLHRDRQVLVSIVPDGTIDSFGSSAPQDNNQGILRVVIRAWREAIGTTVAWRLHGFFAKRPEFERGHVDAGTPFGQSKVDLYVRGTRPLDEPAIAENLDDRVVVTFRVTALYSRSDTRR